jgi:hypothetical protein
VYLCEPLTSSKQRWSGGIPEQPYFLLLDKSFPMPGMKNNKKICPRYGFDSIARSRRRPLEKIFLGAISTLSLPELRQQVLHAGNELGQRLIHDSISQPSS